MPGRGQEAGGKRQEVGHRRDGIFLLLLVLLNPSLARGEEQDSCVTCHQLLPDKLGAPVAGMEKDVHKMRGLSCADCHGGDPADPGITAMAPEKGFRKAPVRAEVPGFCGRCHSDEAYMRKFNPQFPTDQEAQYATSIHGQRLAQGDEKVATCVSCHGVHGILPVERAESPVYPSNVARTCARCHADAAYMAGYGIPTDQFAQYQMSVHGEMLLMKRDLSAPACNDCHGNHGAYPPGADSVAAVCGQCHAINRDLFVQSPHKVAFHRLDLPECVACHGNHEVQRTSDDMLGVKDVSVCITCHAPDSKGYRVAAEIQETIEGLKSAMGKAEGTLARAERAGMEVGEAKYDFQQAHEILVRARNVSHTADANLVRKETAAGMKIAAATAQAGERALAELQTRKRTLILPLSVIFIVMALLYLKIREIERR